jgi:ribosome-binding factor A
MASNRICRINEDLQRELSALIRVLKDPRVQQSMVSITKVDTTGDLRYAKVYISVLDKDKSKETLKGLRSAGGYLRREIAGRLHLRYTPELVFEEDDSIAYGVKMFDLLRSLETPKEEDDGHADHS